MELTTLQTLLAAPDQLQKAMIAEKEANKGVVALKDAQEQYNPKKHTIADASKRPDKLVTLDDGSQNVVPVARIPIPMQKRIVKLAATFLCGRPIQLISNPADDGQKSMLQVVQKTWDQNKLDYKSKKLAKLMMSEMECAELWYPEAIEEGYWIGTANDLSAVKYKLRMRILAASLGDTLVPVFNASGDMIAFGRGYSTTDDGKKVEHFDIYTAEKNLFLVKGDTGWTVAKEEANMLGKIPVIYYSQEAPEWYDVQEMIERLEKSISNHADTNDYHGSPTILVKGDVKGFTKKGESGKVLELEPGADANYMEWNHATDSIKLEQETLRNEIYSQTDTPNISFEQMKGLGTFSGIALKMLFLGAHMKASDHEENFGESIQRRINLLIAGMAVINVKLEGSVNLKISPKFEYFLPKNEAEMVDMLSTANGGKPIMSTKTAVTLNPFVSDPETEQKEMEKEASAAGVLDNQFN